MARTAEITDGSTTIDLISSSDGKIIAERGGFGSTKVNPNQFDEPGNLENQLMVENWKLVVKGTSQDNAASQYQEFVRLLRKAFRYYTKPKLQTTPVYLKFQATSETGVRYAQVYQSPELENPDFFNFPFEGDAHIEPLGLSVARFGWQTQIPGDLPTALTQTATDGPASPTLTQVANHLDDGTVTVVKHYDDSTTTYSSNLLSAANGTALWPASPAADDLLLISGADRWSHAVFSIATAASIDWDIIAEYYNGSTWETLTLGTHYTLYHENGAGSVTDEDDLFTQTSQWSINLKAPSDWASLAIDGDTNFWIRFRIVSVTSTTTLPTKDGDAIYSQTKPYIELPNTALKGDVPPVALLRLFAPLGGDQNESFANLSRIIIGAKNTPGNFVSHINLGNRDMPSGWAATYGTDASAVADTEAPGHRHAAVSFATDETLVARVTTTGTARLGDFKGRYRAFVRVQQIGGAAGDIGVILRTYIHESNVYSPKHDLPAANSPVVTQITDSGLEVLDLGLLTIPFEEYGDADSFTNADLIFQLLAERTTGSGTLEFFDLILVPVDQWFVELKDPLDDTVNGTTALRGNTALDVDGGVLKHRTARYIRSGSNLYVAGSWIRGGPPPLLEPSTQTRLYFLMMHYPTTWGQPPLMADLGCHLAVEVYGAARYLALRGAE